MRADRLLSLVLLLRHRGRMTASALARELTVSTRTVLRDIDALSAAGVPVYSERGRDGGFALLPGFTTDLTGLTHDEAVALLTSRSRVTSEALGMGPAFSSAMAKLVAAMPDDARSRATDAADRVLVRRGGLIGEPEPDRHPEAVQRAVLTGHRLRIRYPSRGEPPSWRTVDPLGLVSAAGRWYLLALHDGADRTYRVNRITEAEELAEPAARPAGVDLEELWQRRRAQFLSTYTGIRARLRIRPSRRAEIVRISAGVTDVSDEGEWLVVDVGFGDLQHAERVMWSLAVDAEALDPPELREAIRVRAQRLVDAHTPRAT
ncbi:MAG: DNA-binding transcriptional regulator [Pseudonocardia sp. SCN 72-86]|nr:MAG: DNA-binding transcriptional regulator [Pseudonocardia sp. SCN 72-86]